MIPVFNSDKPIGVGPEIQLGGEEIALVFPTGNINPLRVRRRWYRRCLSFSARRRSSWSRWNRDGGGLVEEPGGCCEELFFGDLVEHDSSGILGDASMAFEPRFDLLRNMDEGVILVSQLHDVLVILLEHV